MPDTLIREATSFQSNLLCPVPQYWNEVMGTYEKLEGANGATRVVLYDASGAPLLTVGNAGYVQMADGSNIAFGAKADGAATTDTGTFSLIALIKRSLQNWTSLLARIPALGSALKAASIPVNIASDQTVPVSASSLPLPTGAATESTISAINTKLGAALPLPTGAASEATLASILAKIIAAPATETTLASIAAELGVVGVQANAWSAVSVSANGNSAVVDCQYQNQVSAFGNANAATTISAWVSQDNVNFYKTANEIILSAAGDFHFSFQSTARYIRLRSSAAATITATIAGK